MPVISCCHIPVQAVVAEWRFFPQHLSRSSLVDVLIGSGEELLLFIINETIQANIIF
jgi:hypothetical protein